MDEEDNLSEDINLDLDSCEFEELTSILGNSDNEFEIIVEKEDVNTIVNSGVNLNQLPLFVRESGETITEKSVENEPLVCQFCSALYKRRAALQNHIDRVHDDIMYEDEFTIDRDTASQPLASSIEQEENITKNPVKRKTRKATTKPETELDVKFHDGLRRMVLTHLDEILEAMFKNSVLNIRVSETFETKANVCSRLAKSCLDTKVFAEEKGLEFVDRLFNPIWEIVQLKVRSSDSNSQCSMLHGLKVDRDLRKLFIALLKDHQILKNDQQCDAAEMLFTHIVNKYYENCIHWCRQKISEESKDRDKVLDLSLTVQEKKVLVYVAGFIGFALLKKYKSNSSTSSKLISSLVNSWRSTEKKAAVDGDNHISHSWIDRVDRGWLFHPSDGFYTFVLRMEIAAWRVLNANLMRNYCGEDIRDVLMEEFKRDQLLEASWGNLTRHYHNESVLSKLKDMILRKWIGIRAKSFLNAWIQCAKRARKESDNSKKISDKGEPSLRKTLFVKTN